MTRTLLMVGSSVRSAALSARRAGWNPLAIDQFADQDLRSICPTQQVVDYPRGILALARQLPNCPFLYTGALENYPAVLENLARERPLLGNGPEIVRAVRDPWTLRAELAKHDCRFPRILRQRDWRPGGGWLRKPFRSGGGLGIRHAVGSDHDAPFSADASQRLEPTHYYQQLVSGTAISAQFVAADGIATRIGITRQLSGCRWSGASEFLHVGNIGPLTVAPPVSDAIRRIGNLLAANFQLTGLFGVDFILSTNDLGAAELWVLEVNPRLTSAMELFERALGFSAIQTHVEACESRGCHPPVWPPAAALQAKGIVYARREVVIPDRFAIWSHELNDSVLDPLVADLPAVGSRVLAGQPICTVFATGDTEATAEFALRAQANCVYSIVESAAS